MPRSLLNTSHVTTINPLCQTHSHADENDVAEQPSSPGTAHVCGGYVGVETGSHRWRWFVHADGKLLAQKKESDGSWRTRSTIHP